MFPKDIISIVVPYNIDANFSRIMLTKESNLEKAVNHLLETMESNFNTRLKYFMYEVEDHLDYLLEDEDSEYFVEKMIKELGEEKILSEIKNAFSSMPDYNLEKETEKLIYDFMFDWISEKYRMHAAKGINTLKTESNKQKIIEEIINFEFTETVSVSLQSNNEVIENLFYEILLEMKTTAPTLSDYLDKAGFFKEIEEEFEKDFKKGYSERVILNDSEDILFFN